MQSLTYADDKFEWCNVLKPVIVLLGLEPVHTLPAEFPSPVCFEILADFVQDTLNPAVDPFEGTFINEVP